MNNSNWASLLGLAYRARKVISGEELVVKEIQKQKAKLVLIAADASENTAKKVTDKCRYYKIQYKTVKDREELGMAIGKEARVVVAVMDKGFASKLLTLLG